jgi:WD40 repeat protein
LRGHTDSVGAVAYSPDGTLLASASDDQTVKLWKTSDLSLQATLSGEKGFLRYVGFSPDGQTLATAGYRMENITLWDVAARKPKATLRGPHGAFSRAAWSADGRTLAAAYSGDLGSPMICFWDVDMQKELTQHRQEGRWVNALAFSPQGEMVATGTGQNSVRVGKFAWLLATAALWDWKTGKEAATWTEALGSIQTLTFAPDGSLLAFGGHGGRVQLHRLREPRENTVLTMSNAWTNALAFSPNSRWLAIGNEDSHLCVWDVAAEKLHGQLDGHTEAVRAVAFSPDGKHLASAGKDNTVRVWDLSAPWPPSRRPK